MSNLKATNQQPTKFGVEILKSPEKNRIKTNKRVESLKKDLTENSTNFDSNFGSNRHQKLTKNQHKNHPKAFID
jgi:hypothetical protein